ncbi:hypothetical protein GF325_14325 [Candidatus Bathyarchaeota archaeon]|nr:hypothetical protein [Candidatus Bathyarchaeota archaeon]
MNLPISIVLSLLVALLNTVGYYLQKKGQNQIEGDLPFLKYIITAVKTPTWLVGFIIALASMPIYIYAISIGHLSITQPIANTGIIFLVVIGIKYLKEKLGTIEITGIVMLVTGIFLVSLALPEPKETYNLIDTEIAAFFITFLALAGACIIGVFLGKKALGYSILSGICMGGAATVVKLISIQITDLGYDEFSLLDFELDWQLLTGIFGGEFFVPSILLYLTIILIASQLLTLAIAFKHGNLTYVIPLEMGTSFILPVFTGFFLFHEPATIFLVISICVALTGALLLSRMQVAMEASLEATMDAKVKENH